VVGEGRRSWTGAARNLPVMVRRPGELRGVLLPEIPVGYGGRRFVHGGRGYQGFADPGGDEQNPLHLSVVEEVVRAPQ